jgi:hypothetical protein
MEGRKKSPSAVVPFGMANLSFAEKHKLEKLLGMGSGYVLDFSNRTFQEFVFDSVARDIEDPKYARISILEAFNHVRNEKSLAHDNPVLNYSESLLIFNHVASSIRFIAALEDTPKQTETSVGNESEDEFPF